MYKKIWFWKFLRILRPWFNLFESRGNFKKNTVYGPNAYCFSHRCSEDGTSYEVVKDFSSFEYSFLCEKEGDVIDASGWGLKITCRDPQHICKQRIKCYKNCHGRGKCLDNGKCMCNSLYGGEHCETFTGCPSNISNICNDLKLYNYYDEIDYSK